MEIVSDPLQSQKQLLQDIKQRLSLELGVRLDRVYLYGSQARGEASPDSDVDILVVVNKGEDYAAAYDIAGQIACDLSLEYNTVVCPVIVTRREYEQQRTPFLANVHREGVAI
jgi:predicted nucleotidyltransferase